MRKDTSFKILEAFLRTILFGLAILYCGCWKPPFNEMPNVDAQFDPRSGDAIEGWVVEVHPLPLLCPDGSNSTVTLVRPQDEVMATSTTLLFHSASFDYVYDDNGAIRQYRNPSAFTRDWALRRAHTTIGHYVDSVEDDDLTGAMAQALVEQGSQIIVPGNCWGDMWHNAVAEEYANDVALDGFSRLGGDAAQWAFKLGTVPGFGAETTIENSDALVSGTIYAVGFAEGGRAIGELLVRSGDLDGAIVDSSHDDLEFYYTNASAFPEFVMGLDRIFATDSVGLNQASLAQVSRLPSRVAYIYSSLDEKTPFQIHEKAVSVLAGSESHWIKDINVSGHNTSGNELGLAREAVAHMMNLPTEEE